MDVRMAPGLPCAKCKHGVYIQKVHEGRYGEGALREVITPKRFTRVYWLCANCGSNPRTLWQNARREEKKKKQHA